MGGKILTTKEPKDKHAVEKVYYLSSEERTKVFKNL